MRTAVIEGWLLLQNFKYHYIEQLTVVHLQKYYQAAPERPPNALPGALFSYGSQTAS
jgi:hypothetical protein